MEPEPDAVLTLRVVSGDQQVVTQGETLPEPILLEVRDSSTGNGVASVPITVRVTKGALSPATGRQDRMGDWRFDGRSARTWSTGSA